jgi:hypothetical protein
MSQATAVFSALRAYDANLGQRQADWLENPQIKNIPFHLVDKSFLEQQSLTSVVQGSRAIDRLLSIASRDEIKDLQPISQLFHQILSDKSYLQSQSLDELRSAKGSLVEQKVHAFERAYYLEDKTANMSMQSIDSMISKINDVAAEKLASPKMSAPVKERDLLSGAAAARSDLPRPRGISRSFKKQARSEHLAGQSERRMAFAPHLAAMMGLELKKDTSRLQRAARVNLAEPKPLNESERIEAMIDWAQREAQKVGKEFPESFLSDLRDHAENRPPEVFQQIVRNLLDMKRL